MAERGKHDREEHREFIRKVREAHRLDWKSQQENPTDPTHAQLRVLLERIHEDPFEPKLPLIKEDVFPTTTDSVFSVAGHTARRSMRKYHPSGRRKRR